MRHHDDLLRLPSLARSLRLPALWLRRESDAGRIPHIRIGRQRIYSLSAVERVLAERAAIGERSHTKVGGAYPEFGTPDSGGEL